MCASFFSRGERDQPVVALLTDFGLTDAYVGIMKGVVLSRCPAARIIDVSHGVRPGDIHGGAYLLASSAAYFPRGTIFAVVVDPGVGSGRGILAASAGGHWFVAPDNGVLSELLVESPPQQIVSVTNAAHFLEPISDTFHGRDIFAPVAAALARGVALDELGPPVHDWFRLPRLEPLESPDGEREGQVIYVDHFGNLITSFRAGDVDGAAGVIVAGRRIAGLSRSYADADSGNLLALIGSTGRLEISINGGSAAAALDAGVGTPVRLLRVEG